MQPQEIAITFEEFISRVHPEDRDTIRERNINLLQEKETFRFDYRIPLPDGNTRIVHTESRLYRDKAGNPLRIVGTVQDVTEKTRAERERERYIERLTVLNGLTQKVSTSLDLDEVLQSILESTEVFLNVSNIAVYTHNGDAFRLKACRGSYFEERPHRTYSLGEGFVGAAAEGGSLIFIDDVAGHPGWKDKKAALKWGIRTSLCIPLKSEGRVIGVLSCLTSQPREYTDEEYLLIESLANMAAIAIRNAENHSNLRKTLEELRRSQEMIVRAEKLSSLGTLAAGAAHEILNPASVIRMRAELIAEDNPEEGLEYQSANIIVRNIDRIRNICDDLRKFSRDEVSNFELFDLRGVLRFSYELLKHEFSPKGIASSLNLDNSPLEVMGNSGHLQQVFVNLIKNALDASSGEGEISVSTSSAELDGTPFWEIRVSDSGTGIPKETLPRIFDPFFTTKDPDKGTGLGLSIIHGIVKDHGGEIFVESKEGKGTTFIVRLPRAYKKSTD
jgi:signal transduction histidine kinase